MFLITKDCHCALTLTMLFTMGDHKLQHLVHRPHEEDDPQLGHPHRDQTPQEDGREYGLSEGRSLWEKSWRFVLVQLKYIYIFCSLKRWNKVNGWEHSSVSVFVDSLGAASDPFGSFSVECRTSPFFWLSRSPAVFWSDEGSSCSVLIWLLCISNHTLRFESRHSVSLGKRWGDRPADTDL